MLVNAYNYITMMKNRGVNIRATNNSYGGCGEACGYDQATKDALDAMGDAGIINAFAAGNANTNNDTTPPTRSATQPKHYRVASSTSTDARRLFEFWRNSVDLAAPGIEHFEHVSQLENGNRYIERHVDGNTACNRRAALLSSFNPNLSGASLKASLLNNVDVLASDGTAS